MSDNKTSKLVDYLVVLNRQGGVADCPFWQLKIRIPGVGDIKGI